MLRRITPGFLVLVVWLALACGANPSGANPSGTHIIQSLSLSPSFADAQNYPAGDVPFVATGHYDSAPVTVNPIQASWAAQSVTIWNGTPVYGPTNGAVSVDANGLAQCAPGASGTYAIIAWAIQDPNVKGGCGSSSSFGEP